MSIYQPGDGDEELPLRVATKYFARMPESGMTTLFAQQGEAVFGLLQERTFREMVMVCDGKPALWATIESDPVYSNATQILDFFHAAEHLSHAAEAIFGKKKQAAGGWHAKYRARLLEDPGVSRSGR